MDNKDLNALVMKDTSDTLKGKNKGDHATAVNNLVDIDRKIYGIGCLNLELSFLELSWRFLDPKECSIRLSLKKMIV